MNVCVFSHYCGLKTIPRKTRRTVNEILDNIAQNRFQVDLDGPGVVDMLREDGNR